MRISILFFLFFGLVGVMCWHEVADARAGGGISVGSRGTRTYNSSPSAAPITRSYTSPAPTSSPRSPYSPSVGAPASSHPFMSGLFGGLVGAGLGSLLFGGGGGYGMGGGGGMGLLPLLLLGGLIYFFYKRLSAGNSVMMPPGLSSASAVGSAPADGGMMLAVTDEDKHTIEQLFYQIQSSWSAGDLNHLRMVVTPEMLQYFNEQLSTNSSRGLMNKVEQVHLQHAEIMESWNEYGMDYATARLEWTAVDYMVRLDRDPSSPEYVASGSPTRPDPVQEIWTFARASGGRWLLSAIQQVA